jgi:hypothetical protein
LAKVRSKNLIAIRNSLTQNQEKPLLRKLFLRTPKFSRNSLALAINRMLNAEIQTVKPMAHLLRYLQQSQHKSRRKRKIRRKIKRRSRRPVTTRINHKPLMYRMSFLRPRLPNSSKTL